VSWNVIKPTKSLNCFWLAASNDLCKTARNRR